MTLADVLARGWLELFYQPKIELKSTRMVGAEGLVRARHPTRGLLGPGAFLPGASEADMLALTERVIISALKDWEDVRSARDVIEALGKRAGIRAGEAANTGDLAGGATACAELAGHHHGGHRR